MQLSDGSQLDYVNRFKYLGLEVPLYGPVVFRLCRQFKERLRALKAVAGYHSGYGANVRIVKMMYFAYIRSLVDYAAPLLVLMPERKLGGLEKLQNEALRIILGCPRTTKILNMRKELNILSVVDRVTEINCQIGIKMLRLTHPNPCTEALQNFFIEDQHCSKWITKTGTQLRMYGVHDLYQEKQQRHFPAPWEVTPFPVLIPPFPPKKQIRDQPKLRLEAKLNALSHIDALSTEHSLSQIIYTDGSLHRTTGAAGSAVVMTMGDGLYLYFEWGVRINNWASTLQTELFALILALKCVQVSKLDTLIVSDSLSSLNALNSLRHNCNMLVSEARHKYNKIIKDGNSPFHVVSISCWPPNA
ncbi:uncharacterized protein [Procambarus clarkii]|uniref:uncharacterized protein isoform X1 n=1 Tax=Procambarus clarkii TaxID=6728 RepID=UPI003744012D